ncbi:MAG: hypothetical protein WC822_02250 [Candidatus Paceibacterota bacterium]|jgi:hypothetical protein
MDRKTLVALFVGVFVLSAAPVMAATVGGVRRDTNMTTVLPVAGTTLSCSRVSVSTKTPTAVLAAKVTRLAFWIVNSSTQNFDTAANSRPPYIKVGVPSTATAPVVNESAGVNGLLLAPCFKVGANITYEMPAGCQQFAMQGSSIYNGAIYAVAESTTISTGSIGKVDACEVY